MTVLNAPANSVQTYTCGTNNANYLTNYNGLRTQQY